MDQSYGEDLPIIFDLFGVPDPANPAPAIDPEQRQKRLHSVVKRVLHDPAHSAAPAQPFGLTPRILRCRRQPIHDGARPSSGQR